MLSVPQGIRSELEKSMDSCIFMLKDMGYKTDRVGCVEPVGPISADTNRLGFIWLGNSYVIARNPERSPATFVLIKLAKPVGMSAYKNTENLRKKLIESVLSCVQIGAGHVGVEPCVIAFLNHNYLSVNDKANDLVSNELRVESLIASYAPKVARKSSKSAPEAKYIAKMIQYGFLSHVGITKIILENTKVSIQHLLGVGDHRRVSVRATIGFNAAEPLLVQV